MERKIYIVFFLFSLSVIMHFSIVTIAQDWPKIYGDNFHSLINDLSESYDKGFYLTAFTYDNQGIPEYGWIIKTDVNGNILWDKKYGDGSYMNWFSSSSMTSDNGLIISGITSKYSSGDNDPLFMKTTTCSEIEWCKVFVCPDQNYGSDVLQMEDGSYIGLLTYYGEGETYSRISLVKMDQSGEPIWIQRLAQEDSTIHNEESNFLYLTSDNNFLVSGQCFHPALQPLWIKTDTSGFQIWDMFWPGGIGVAYQLIEMENAHYYSVGSYAGSNMPFTPTLYKFDELGNPLNKVYILSDTIDGGEARTICSYTNSKILVGIIWGTDTNPAIYNSELFLLDTLGNIVNRKLLLNEDKAPKSIIKTCDDKILVTGNYVVDNNWDIYLWKLNSDLQLDTLYTQPLTYDSLCTYQIQSDTVDLDCGVFVYIDELPTKEEYESTIKISPNPARDWVVLTLPDVVAQGAVELAVYDVFGKEAEMRGSGDEKKGGKGDKGTGILGEVNKDNRNILMNIADYPSGMYIAVVIDKKNRRYTGKFVVER